MMARGIRLGALLVPEHSWPRRQPDGTVAWGQATCKGSKGPVAQDLSLEMTEGLRGDRRWKERVAVVTTTVLVVAR